MRRRAARCAPSSCAAAASPPRRSARSPRCGRTTASTTRRGRWRSPPCSAAARPARSAIGFGNGEHLVGAAAEPQRDFIGVEVHPPGIGRLLLPPAPRACGNLRVIGHDAVGVLREQIAPAALDEIEILFPDLRPKKRHHKRRLIQDEFVAAGLPARRGRSAAYFATDWNRTPNTCATCCSAAR
ncbi:MAG: hypothetical protein U1F06_10770 [Steroidobacteraceae bacterium]